jgi:hypothetical protein
MQYRGSAYLYTGPNNLRRSDMQTALIRFGEDILA